MNELQMIQPDWPIPDNVVAFTTTRVGGVSKGVYQGFNLADHVGDNSTDVQANRARLLSTCEGLDSIKWLQQVHSTTAIDAGKVTEGELQAADASYTTQAGLACVVMTADCLPLLICQRQGQEVAAIHAGWRGLLDGIIEKTIHSMKSSPEDLLVWLGPAISDKHYEVGPEIYQQFVSRDPQAAKAFAPSPDTHHHYMANLYGLTKQRLEGAGIPVHAVYGGDYCTYADSDQFYSYRRDGETGRIASLIYRKSYP